MPPLETLARARRCLEEQTIQDNSLVAFLSTRKRTLPPESHLEDELDGHGRRLRQRREGNEPHDDCIPVSMLSALLLRLY